MKIKILTLTKSERGEFMLGFRMRCRAVSLKSEGLSSVYVGIQTEITVQSVNG